MKRPAFQFYPADWRKDSALQSCSIAARGLWMELMCIMHECEPYGYLCVNSKAMDASQISRLVGESQSVIKKLLGELESAGVSSRDEQGALYSRRMVRDERLRSIRAEAGRLGGNPDLVGHKDNVLLKQTDNHIPNQSTEQSPTPSSSSSSSSTKSKEKDSSSPRATRLPPGWVLPQPWGEWALADQPSWTPEHVRRIAEGFRDYWLAAGGANARKVDWQAAWRGWVRREKPLSHGPPSGHNGYETAKTKELNAAKEWANVATGRNKQPDVIDITASVVG